MGVRTRRAMALRSAGVGAFASAVATVRRERLQVVVVLGHVVPERLDRQRAGSNLGQEGVREDRLPDRLRLVPELISEAAAHDPSVWVMGDGHQ